MHYLNGLIDGYLYTVDVLEKNNACKYYDTIFNQHLSVWLSDVALSETISLEDKKVLVEKSAPLFKKLKNIEPFPENNAIKSIINQIVKDNLDEAFMQMGDYQLFTNRIHNLEVELNQKTAQVARLQTTKGWFKYKINNIKERLF